MNWIDKIFLLLALAITGASAALFMGAEADGPGTTSTVATPTGEDFVPLTMESAETREFVEWAEPEPIAVPGNDVEPIYYVFTPPKIYWDTVNETFVFELIEPPEPDPAFGMELVGIEREKFRIQLETILQDITGETTLSFYLPKTGAVVTGNPGDEKFREFDFEVVSFVREDRVKLPDGTYNNRAAANIRDLDSGQEIELTSDANLFVPNSFYINLRALEPNEPETFTLRKTGDTYRPSNRDAVYTLVDFDVDNQTATVRQESPELRESPVQKVLSADDGESPLDANRESVNPGEPSEQPQQPEDSDEPEDDTPFSIFE